MNKKENKQKSYTQVLGSFGELEIAKILNSLSSKNDAFVVSENKDRYETIKRQLKNNDGKPDVIFTDANGNLKSIEVKTETNDQFVIRLRNKYTFNFIISILILDNEVLFSCLTFEEEEALNSYAGSSGETNKKELTIPKSSFGNYDKFINLLQQKMNINFDSFQSFSNFENDFKNIREKLNESQKVTDIGTDGENIVHKLLPNLTPHQNRTSKEDFDDIENNKKVEVKTCLNWGIRENGNKLAHFNEKNPSKDNYIYIVLKIDNNKQIEKYSMMLGYSFNHTLYETHFTNYNGVEKFQNDYNKIIENSKNNFYKSLLDETNNVKFERKFNYYFFNYKNKTILLNIHHRFSKNHEKYNLINTKFKSFQSHNPNESPDIIIFLIFGEDEDSKIQDPFPKKYCIRRIEDVKETVMESQFEEFDMNEFMNDLDRVIDEIQNKNKLLF